MSNKKGQGISMQFVVLAALALIVLIVVALVFSKGIESILGKQKQVVGIQLDAAEVEFIASKCKLWCTNNELVFFDEHDFNKGGEYKKCAEGQTCEVKCSEYVDKKDCKVKISAAQETG